MRAGINTFRIPGNCLTHVVVVNFTNGKKKTKGNPHKEFRRDPGRGVKEGA